MSAEATSVSEATLNPLSRDLSLQSTVPSIFGVNGRLESRAVGNLVSDSTGIDGLLQDVLVPLSASVLKPECEDGADLRHSGSRRDKPDRWCRR